MRPAARVPGPHLHATIFDGFAGIERLHGRLLKLA